jgi:hypothetical protein
LRRRKEVESFVESFTAFAEVKESQNSVSFVADNKELIKENNGNNNEVADRTSLCLATDCPKTDDGTCPQELGNNKLATDDRTISQEKFRVKICEDNRLSTEQWRTEVVVWGVLTPRNSEDLGGVLDRMNKKNRRFGFLL